MTEDHGMIRRIYRLDDQMDIDDSNSTDSSDVSVCHLITMRNITKLTL